jgi:hypothetical protein
VNHEPIITRLHCASSLSDLSGFMACALQKLREMASTTRQEDHMRTITIAGILSLMCAAGLAAQEANPPRNPPPQTPRAPTADTTVQPTTTLAGCLYREEQVPGRKPNVAERAGLLEDYILADASTVGTQRQPGPTGVPASGNMYKVEGPADEKLKALVGKRVEVSGRIDPEGGPAASPGSPRPDRGLGPDKINLPEVEATSIREISGTCPARPAPRN